MQHVESRRTRKNTSALNLWRGRVASPIGDILLVWDDDAVLRALDFHDHEPRMQRLLRLHYGPVTPVRAAVPAGLAAPLEAYFAGDPHPLATLPFATGGTAFQREVWAALRRIPPGGTLSYAELACSIGRPAACRAVGGANGANPVAIVVPCHRVIGKDRTLTGFGGGVERKGWLLAHEGSKTFFFEKKNQKTFASLSHC